MDLIDNIIYYFKNETDKEGESSPQGTCPVCWGFQHYDGKIRTLFKDKQIDVNNHKESYMVIQDFMTYNIDGIKLKEGLITNCPDCTPELEN